MSFTPQALLSGLAELESASTAAARFVIAFSGGLDSTVLLHALATTRDKHGKDLFAIHVDHGLQPESAAWAEHCSQLALTHDIEFVVHQTQVAPATGRGPEAAAREARYAMLAKHITPGDWLLSAHHKDDQAETLLINLLRGSGPLGVAGIPVMRAFAGGSLVRPMLGFSREDLHEYAERAGLDWIDDPSNDGSEFDRNFLRNDVLPLIARRWPEAGASLARSADLARDAAGLLAELADIDLAGLFPYRLPLEFLAKLSPSRARNALRRAASLSGLPPPPAAQLEKILTELVPAREDAEPLVRWPGAEIRRYRDHLYLMSASPEARFEGVTIDRGEGVELGPGLGRLRLVDARGEGVAETLVDAGLHLRVRRGGEKIRLKNQSYTRQIKKLLQENAVVPWLRDVLPLVYSGDRLVAVADLWIAGNAASPNGLAIEWCNRPALH